MPQRRPVLSDPAATVRGMDLTAPTATLAGAAGEVARLIPGRLLDPVLAGVLLTADAHGATLVASDRECSLRLTRTAVVHTEGRALVAAKPLADTLRALDTEQVRLVVEGSRLAIRTPNARFALPLLDVDSHPGVLAPPAIAGTVRGDVWRSAVTAVASAASRDDALPIFTGLRIWAENERLVMVASDRYRMAMGTMPWHPAPHGAPVDLLAPAATLIDVAKQTGRADTVTLHADADRIGLSWKTDSLSTALLAAPFPDQRARELLKVTASSTVDIDADSLSAAVRRASPYAGPHGTVTLIAGDAQLRVQGNDPQTGESEETVKATVSGDHSTKTYQARYLGDALRPFAGRTVAMHIQDGRGATLFTAAPDATEVELTYLVVPMQRSTR